MCKRCLRLRGETRPNGSRNTGPEARHAQRKCLEERPSHTCVISPELPCLHIMFMTARASAGGPPLLSLFAKHTTASCHYLYNQPFCYQRRFLTGSQPQILNNFLSHMPQLQISVNGNYQQLSNSSQQQTRK